MGPRMPALTSKMPHNEARALFALLNLDSSALLVAIVSVPLSIYGDWLPAVLCAVALFAVDRFQKRIAKPDKAGVKKMNLKLQPEFTVCPAAPADAESLQYLYTQDYLQIHKQMHQKVDANMKEWEVALGPVDFAEVLRGNDKDVKLLKCIDNSSSSSPVGYILYQLREKGPRGKRKQRYCELVNIVVHSDHRGCGAGRCLFEAFCEDVVSTAPGFAGDLRLYVAEHNSGPRAWYKRMGFKDAGWQTECLGGSQVRFQRMMYSPTP